jgi:5-carboxymethyl-2-hydroxymuconate isomerase
MLVCISTWGKPPASWFVILHILKHRVVSGCSAWNVSSLLSPNWFVHISLRVGIYRTTNIQQRLPIKKTVLGLDIYMEQA